MSENDFKAEEKTAVNQGTMSHLTLVRDAHLPRGCIYFECPPCESGLGALSAP